MIVDAGGGTVDINTYKFTDTAPLSVEEIATPDCKSSWLSPFVRFSSSLSGIVQGSTRVNARAQEFLKSMTLFV